MLLSSATPSIESFTKAREGKYKLFTFGDAEGKYSVHDGIIEYLNGLLITVRSVDPYFIQLIFSKLHGYFGGLSFVAGCALSWTSL